VDVDVPEARHQVRALQVDELRIADCRRRAGVEDLLDAAVLDQDGGVGPRPGLDAIDQRRMGQQGSHVGQGLSIIGR
jgi:hypothetical protein